MNKINRSISIFLLFFGLTSICFSQEVQYRQCLTGCTEADGDDPDNVVATYGVVSTFQTNQVSSDFGPRQLGSDPYDWHGGVDYSSGSRDSDRGDLLIAIEGGTIIWDMEQGYKWIIIDSDGRDYGYGHLFRTSGDYPLKSGNCILKRQLDNTLELALIVPIFENDTISGYRAIGQVEGRVLHGTDTLEVSNRVEAGDVIGPMGSSIAVGRRVNVHLHLYSFANNQFSLADADTKDPLEFVTHTAPNYEVQILDPSDNNRWSEVNYTENQSTKFLVRAVMNNEGSAVSVYQNGVMNVDDVELLIKKEHETDFSRIQGDSMNSIISHGARTDTDKYPLYITRDGSRGNGGGIAQIGNSNRIGIQPFAYADAASHPYDNYFFTDFAPRIHKDDAINTTPVTLASCPQDARYDDGNYQLKAKVTDVRDNETESDEIAFVLDNFQPFIQSVTATIGGKIIYQKEWTCGDDCEGIRFEGSDLDTEITAGDLADGMEVEVVASEPLDRFWLSIPELDVTAQDQGYNADRTEWTVTVAADSLPRRSFITFELAGEDASGNELMDLENYTDAACTAIPFRIGTDSEAEEWSVANFPTGTDATHGFAVNCGASDQAAPRSRTGTTLIISPDDCIHLNPDITHASPEEGATDGAIALNIEGGIAPYIITWEHGPTTEVITDLAPGDYTVTVTDASCCKTTMTYTVKPGCLTFGVVQKDDKP